MLEGRGDAQSAGSNLARKRPKTGSSAALESASSVPLVETFAGQLGCFCRARVHIGINAKHHLAGIGFVGLASELAARLDIVVHGLVEGLLEFIDALAVKSDDIGDTGYVAEEDLVLRIEGDASRETLVGHNVHGLTPRSSRKRRASRIW